MYHIIFTEFLLGNDLLVAPVLEEGVTMRKIYLPKGNWANRGNLNDLYYKSKILSGNCHVAPSCGLARNYIT